MRRSQCQIKDLDTIFGILSRARVGRLATIDEAGYPYIVPVNFVLYENCIYFHCALEGEKLENIGRDPKVCFEVDEPLAYIEVSFNEDKNPCKAHQLYRSVVVRGKARVVDSDSLKLRVLNALVAKYEGTEDFSPVVEGSSHYKACHVVEIVPESITGKEDLLQGKPEELKRAIAQKLFERGYPGDLEAVRAMGFPMDCSRPEETH